jgi:C-terminal processing protease CtpA/Prc
MKKLIGGLFATGVLFGLFVVNTGQALAEEVAAAEREAARQTLERARIEMEAAREALREATRVMAEAYGELHIETPRAYAYSFMSNPRKAMIGVVTEAAKGGLELVSVTPDGPAEKAGLEVGDVLVSVNGEKLVVDDYGELEVLLEELSDVEVGDEVSIDYLRNGQETEVTVIAERREPFMWQNVIEGEDFDAHFSGAMEDIEIRIDDMETGMDDMHYSFAAGANVVIDRVFGISGLHELELASINEGLGSYFGTERGVLVLEAPVENDWQLKAGDVILSINGNEADSPSQALRMLRSHESGETVDVEIMRDKDRKNLSVTVPELDAHFGHKEAVKVIRIDRD